MKSENSKILISRKVILKNKWLLLAIVLGLALPTFFFFKWPKAGQSSTMIDDQSGFVMRADEEKIQPVIAESEGQNDRVIESEAELSKNCHFTDIYKTSGSDQLNREIEIPILTYHYIEETPVGTNLPGLFENTEIFEAQLKSIKNACYETVLVHEVAGALLADKALPAKPLALTFDDGYADMYYNVFPLLKKYNQKGTMYVIVNALGTPGYLTKEQLVEMDQSGLVEIASHTLNHVNLLKVSDWVAVFELSESKKELEKILGHSVTDFAYPYGFFTERDGELCRQVGYETCVSTYPGDIQSFNNRFSLYRLRPDYRIGIELIDWLEGAGPKR
jgi:peptidoglycan/xylan/chitin deacetylase (PgdA/CDA1 family)